MKILKYILILMIVFVSVVVVQVYQYGKKVDSVRLTALHNWSNGDTEKENLVKDFIANCTGSTVKNTRKNPPLEIPISIYDCAVKYSGNEVSDIIRKSGDTVSVPAPVKWL
jgi:hypothetical protein